MLCVASRCIKDDELNLGQTLYELDVDEKGAPWLRAEQNDNLVIVLCDIIDIVIKYGNVAESLDLDYIEKKNLLPVRKILMEREDMLKIRERLRKICVTRLNPLRYFDDTYIQNPMFDFGGLILDGLLSYCFHDIQSYTNLHHFLCCSIFFRQSFQHGLDMPAPFNLLL